MRWLIAGCLLSLVTGCSQDESGPGAPPDGAGPAGAIVLKAPVVFSVAQRTTHPLPGSRGKIVVTLGDITGGQVITTVTWRDGRPIVARRSLREHERLTFRVDGRAYTLQLQALRNVLVGTDTASFGLWSGTGDRPAGDSSSEERRIEELIASIGKLKGAKFIRNGQAHTAAEAMAHMRKKWQWKKSQIRTAEDFIRVVGTRSSTTGKPYVIRLADGTEIKAARWFRNQLKALEQESQ